MLSQLVAELNNYLIKAKSVGLVVLLVYIQTQHKQTIN